MLSQGQEDTRGVVNHDPNLRWADKTFRLTFRLWEYEATHDVVIGGNCAGLSSLDAAVSNFLDTLPPEYGDEGYQIILTRPRDGENLQVGSEDEDGEDWLMRMLVSAELIDVQPEKPASLTEGAR